MYEHDVNTEAHGLATPGIDPRQWGSYATVDADTADSRSVLFNDPETGAPYPFPTVLVTLQPSGIQMPCRVAASASGSAGNGEGEWTPFVAGDEVYVLLPEGHERACGIITGRFNQEHDKFPTQVAGADATKNTFAFRRSRTPYIFETSASYLVRSAGSKAFLSMDQTGKWTMATGDNHMLHLGPDFLALQLGTNDAMVQIAPASGSKKATALLQGDAAQLLIDSTSTALLTPGNVSFSTAGNAPLEHVMTTEALANILIALGALMTPPMTPVQVIGAFTTAAAASLPSVATSAIVTALGKPKTAGSPGIGCPGFLVG